MSCKLENRWKEKKYHCYHYGSRGHGHILCGFQRSSWLDPLYCFHPNHFVMYAKFLLMKNSFSENKTCDAWAKGIQDVQHLELQLSFKSRCSERANDATPIDHKLRHGLTLCIHDDDNERFWGQQYVEEIQDSQWVGAWWGTYRPCITTEGKT